MRKKKIEKIRTVLVVYNYHLHGQTGQLTVWENGKKNSGLINFVQESRLLLAQTGFHLTKIWVRKSETGIKDGFEEIEHDLV